MKIYGNYIVAIRELLLNKLTTLKGRLSARKSKLPLDTMGDVLPYYLTREQKDGLARALKDFPTNANYYYHGEGDTVLQGDGWSHLQIFNFQNGQRASVKGIILSNTCDVSPENQRDLPTKLVFAPIIALSAYRDLLTKANIAESSISSKFESIRQQKITNIFYLPKGGDLLEEHIAVLDDIHSMPTVAFFNTGMKGRQFALSQFGFYLFIFKLSIHFCRFHENLART